MVPLFSWVIINLINSKFPGPWSILIKMKIGSVNLELKSSELIVTIGTDWMTE